MTSDGRRIAGATVGHEVMASIVGLATYVPPGRLSLADVRQHWPSAGLAGGTRSVSVAGHDEDAVTLAVQAADDVLERCRRSADDVDLLVVATCSSPYAEHSAASEVARALGLSRSARLVDLAGSTLGGVTGLTLAADAVRAGTAGAALVVAADGRHGVVGSALEPLGAGAAAALVGPDGPVELGATATWRHGVPTRWRPQCGTALQGYEDGRYEALDQVAPALGHVVGMLAVESPAFCALGPLDHRPAGNAAKAAGIRAPLGIDEVATVGDLGAAAPLVALGAVLADAAADDRGLCLAVEPGCGAQGVSLAVSGAVPLVRRRPPPVDVGYVGYLQRHGEIRSPAPPDPIVPHAATPGAARDDLVGSLVGGRCPKCGGLNVPMRGRCAECGGSGLVPERPPRRGTVVTFNDQHVVAVHPEPAPVAVGVVRIEGDAGSRTGQVSVMFCDRDGAELRIGGEAELVYRRLGVESGLVKYGWKARPLGHVGAEGPGQEEGNA